MFKTKLRLGSVFVLSIIFLLIILITYYKTPKDYYGESSESLSAQLNQPFTWDKEENGSTNRSSKEIKTRSTCRNSVQGSNTIADDKGYVCARKDLNSNGCCHANKSQRYSCFNCNVQIGCCQNYERCISCCMDPDKKTHLMSVLNEARALSNILLLSVTDQFELCMAKCRTNSKSVQHENMYINPRKKYCFKKET